MCKLLLPGQTLYYLLTKDDKACQRKGSPEAAEAKRHEVETDEYTNNAD